MATARHDPSVYERLAADVRFRELRRRFRSWTFPMTAMFLVWYLLYVVLSGWARDLMAVKVFGNVNVALILGLLQFVSTFLIAWAYSRYAARKLDPLAEELRREAERMAEKERA